MRRWTGMALAAVVLLLGLAPATGGDAPGLRDDLEAVAVALGGPDVLVARELPDGRVQLQAIPRAGGAPRTLLDVPSARVPWPDSLAATGDRVVLLLERRGSRGAADSWEVYSGPPGGPLAVAWRWPDRGGAGWEPELQDVDGNRALILETPAVQAGLRAWTVDPGVPPIRVPWASQAVAPVAIAGDYAAAITRKPRRVALVDRASGNVVVSRSVGPTSGTTVDVAADGRLVTATKHGGLLTMRPGAAPRTLPATKGLERPAFAGSAIAAIDESGGDSDLVLVADDGSRRLLGGPTGYVTDLAADDQGVAWVANGCVRYASLTGAPPAVPADDLCPATEIGLFTIDTTRLRGNQVRVRVHCIATPADACRGTLLLKHRGRVVTSAPFTVPAGARQRVPVTLSRHAVRIARREGGFLLDAEVPDGRIGPGRDAAELNVKWRAPR